MSWGDKAKIVRDTGRQRLSSLADWKVLRTFAPNARFSERVGVRATAELESRFVLAGGRNQGATRAVSRISLGASVSTTMYFGVSPGRAAVWERPKLSSHVAKTTPVIADGSS